MSDPKKTPTERWTIADLLDFEFFLRADDSSDDPATRDREIAEETLAPALGNDLRADADPTARHRGLRLWLETMRDRADASYEGSPVLTPGESFVSARRTLTVLLALVMLLSGIALATGLLHREWRYYNVVAFLAIALGPQLILLVLFILGWLGRGVLRKKSAGTLGIFQLFTSQAIDWLAQKTRGKGSNWSRKARQTWSDLKRRPWLAWPMVSATQTAAMWFNVGLILGLVGVITVMDVRFFWESTPAMAAVETFHGVTKTFAAPWSWAFSAQSPTLEQIAATKIEITGAEAGLTEADGVNSADTWFGFLILTLLVWGLLPRLVTRLVSGWMTRRAVVGYGFNDRPHRELWRRLTDLHLTVEMGAGQDDDAIVVAWGGVEVPEPDLRTAMLQQLRLNPVEFLTAGGMDPSADETAIASATQAIKQRGRKVRIVLLAEAWSLVPRDLAPFLEDLRNDIGDDVRIVCFITGLSSEAEQTLSAPKTTDLDSWNRFAAEQDDASLFVTAVR